MADSKMPAMIWTGPELVAATRTWGMHNYDKTPAANVAFIRADLVEPLVEALREVRSIISDGAATGFNCHDGDWAERLFKSQATTFAALSSWEAAQ